MAVLTNLFFVFLAHPSGDSISSYKQWRLRRHLADIKNCVRLKRTEASSRFLVWKKIIKRVVSIPPSFSLTSHFRQLWTPFDQLLLNVPILWSLCHCCQSSFPKGKRHLQICFGDCLKSIDWLFSNFDHGGIFVRRNSSQESIWCTFVIKIIAIVCWTFVILHSFDEIWAFQFFLNFLMFLGNLSFEECRIESQLKQFVMKIGQPIEKNIWRN